MYKDREGGKSGKEYLAQDAVLYKYGPFYPLYSFLCIRHRLNRFNINLLFLVLYFLLPAAFSSVHNFFFFTILVFFSRKSLLNLVA